MKRFYLSLVCFAIALTSFGQISPFLEKGQSGFGVGAGLEKGQHFDGFSAKAGVSLNGVFDIEVNYFRDQIDQQLEEITLLKDDATGSYTEILLTWWLLRSKASDFIDVNFGLSPGFEFAGYDGYEYNIGSQSMEYKGYYGGELGVSSNVVFNLEKNWRLMPFYLLFYEVGLDKGEANADESKTNYHGFTSSLGVTLSKRLEKGNSVYFSFRQTSDTYSPGGFYNVEIGYILPW